MWAWPSQASPFKEALHGLKTPAAAGLHLLFFTGFCFPDGSDVKESACNAGDPVLIPGLGRSLEIPWRREWPPTPVFLPGEFHGQNSLVGYSHGVAKSWT